MPTRPAPTHITIPNALWTQILRDLTTVNTAATHSRQELPQTVTALTVTVLAAADAATYQTTDNPRRASR